MMLPALLLLAALQPVRYELDLKADLKEEELAATARITVRNASAQPAGELSLVLYRLMTVTGITNPAGAALPFSQHIVAFEDEPRRQANHIRIPLNPPLAPKAETTVSVAYKGFLAGYVETGSLYIRDRIDEEFTIIREDADPYPAVGVPSFRARRAAGLPEFSYLARITVPESHVVANGGELVNRTTVDGWATFVFRSRVPSWRMDFAIARYTLLEKEGIRIYYLPGDQAGAERVMQGAQSALRLFTDWFGPPREMRGVTVIEIPEGFGSQNDVVTIIQTSAAFRDPERAGELYHEVSHFWNVEGLDRPHCRWEEGLASFLAELAREKLDGVKAIDARVARAKVRLKEQAAKDPRLARLPMKDYGREDIGDYSYGVGLLMFDRMYRIAGHETFCRIIGGFYQQYVAIGATTDQFAQYAIKLGGEPVKALLDEWLYSTRWLEVLNETAR